MQWRPTFESGLLLKSELHRKIEIALKLWPAFHLSSPSAAS